MRIFLNKIKIWLIDEYNLETLCGCILLYPAICKFQNDLFSSIWFLIGVWLILQSYRKYWFEKGVNSNKEEKNDGNEE